MLLFTRVKEKLYHKMLLRWL